MTKAEEAQNESLPDYEEATCDVSAPLLGGEEKTTGLQPVEPPKYEPRESAQDEDDELTNDYSTGLFECHTSPETALMAWCAPCCTFGTINATLLANRHARATDDEEAAREPLEPQTATTWKKTLWSLPYIAGAVLAGPYAECGFGLAQRQSVRRQYNLESHIARDIASHLFCHCCAMAQDHREMLIREEQRKKQYLLAQKSMENDL
ncbi:hypothetical protein TRVA0_034S00650 [Trichomonascus vanleenenianus]|uniref:PLAC8 family protein n=1 Tax=Trichomonascus vanleenenianus TaxID=2268995 RepID=UPI003ECABDBB